MFCPHCGNFLQLNKSTQFTELRLMCPTCPYHYLIKTDFSQKHVIEDKYKKSKSTIGQEDLSGQNAGCKFEIMN